MSQTSELSERYRDQVVSIFNYLVELSRLRSKNIRDIDQYQDVFWFDSLPSDIDCYTIAWGGGEDEEHSDEIWLEVKKRAEPKCPAVPVECLAWIDECELGNSDTPPTLRERILAPQPAVSETEDIIETFSQEPEFLYLADNPDVQAALQTYMLHKWNAWADVHSAWKVVQAAYSALFKIHQELQRLGEQYELILGLGFLTWKTPSDEKIRRHVLVAQAALEFDAPNGVFALRAGADGARLQLEMDMLQPGERPSADQQRTIQEALENATETPWDRSVIVPVLKAWVQSLDHRGEFNECLAPQDEVPKAPHITFAPALILRRRSSRNVLAALEKIIGRLKEPGQDIPPEIIRLVSDADEFDTIVERPPSTDKSSPAVEPEPIFFPLPANDEQRRIVEALQRRRGVLVQGPPGTGKSHTIANLICHLLATGKRVLVTAQTPRALRVLQEKLPLEIAPLCVSLLGNDRAALQNLEHSIAEISNRYARWDEGKNQSELLRLERELTDSKRQLAKLQADARAVRECETRCHEIAGQSYRGSAQQIAKQLSDQASDFEWLQDHIPVERDLPFGPSAFQHLRQNHLDVDANRLAELKQRCPAPDKLLTAEEFVSFVQQENRAADIVESYSDAKERAHFPALANAHSDGLNRFAGSLTALRVAVQNIERRPLKWIKDAIFGILTDQDTPWKSLRDVTVDAINGLKDRAIRIDALSVALPEGISEDQLLADAADLKTHLDSGKGFGWLIFVAKVVRRTRYIAEKVRVDGRTCSDSETLRTLMETLEVQKAVERLWSTWKGKADRQYGPLALQVAELEEHLEALNAVLAVEDQLDAAKEACHAVEGLGEPPWHDSNALEELLHTYKAVTAEKKLRGIRSKLSGQVEVLSQLFAQPNAHPLTTDLMEATRSRAADQYGECLGQLDQFKTDIGKVRQRTTWLNKLQEHAPLFARQLARDPANSEWEDRLTKIADAWNWARASSWLEEYLRPGREEQLEAQITETTTEIGVLTAQVAASRAWGFFFERMTESQRQHLNAWQQEIKKIGKGTGRHAAKHRRYAQENLDKCRDAIPAWVMPLFRIFETISPEPEMFDVLIVDEASQCGPEALILLFLAKKVIVVGDDKQISPEAVGVNQDDVEYLIRQHLTKIDHAGSFGVTSSFSDHGVIRYGNRIVLREHFRCMPEIIRFSNDLCYANNPLIPLRQYPPRRLKPIVTHRVADGYREGTSSRAVNRPEAEAVVKAILACCRDPYYDNKTMGVISLQGNAQARLVETMLMEHIDAEELEDRRIICGDAYSFQGDERDVMFLSLVAAPNMRIGSLTKESDKRRFNVAASRPRDQMWLLHSADLEDLSSSCLRYELLRYCLHPVSQRITLEDLNVDELETQAHSANRAKRKPSRPFDSWFEVDVFLKTMARGYRVIPQFHVAGFRIDLVVEGLSSRLAVECDGDQWHGIERYDQDIERQRTLERCGWKFWRVRGGEFYRDQDFALNSLWDEIKARGIQRASDQFESIDVDGYVPEVDWGTPLNLHSEESVGD